MDHSQRLWQLVGTFLPIYGVILTFVASLLLHNLWRIVALLGVPLATYGLCSLFGEFLAYDGNLLYVTLFALFTVAMLFYYPLLLIVGIVRFMGRRSVKSGKKSI